jgi:predicted ester cyclase
MGVAPTGNTITVSGIGIHRIADGKVVEARDVFDQLDFMQQLGAIPRPDQGGD